eukprot:c24086_g1_i1.p1 GENE.c24086_g1_i1~~c24086_g1_i1.p1  ORF type:complete len:361 (+),score=75.57 c24086_g1_i1:245-1327(+)
MEFVKIEELGDLNGLVGLSASQPWTPQEDTQLEELVAKLGAKNWSNIACVLSGRTGKQCRERWRNHLDPSISKNPFTVDEDKLIVSLVEEMGTKWAKIAKSLPGRTDNSIKNRYYSSLLKRTHERRLNRFSAQEDALIIAVVKRIGTKWSEVSKFLPGRTSKSIKNRYYSALKKTYPILGGHQENSDVAADCIDCSPDNSCNSDDDADEDFDDGFTPSSKSAKQLVDDTSCSGDSCTDPKQIVCESTPPFTSPVTATHVKHLQLTLEAHHGSSNRKLANAKDSVRRIPTALAERIQSSCLFGFVAPASKSKISLSSRQHQPDKFAGVSDSLDFHELDLDQEMLVSAAKSLCDLKRACTPC